MDFWPVALISLIPLGTALWGFSHRCAERACALPYAVANIKGYFAFQALVVIYFIYAAVSA